MRTVGIIPARYGSERLPGKPLLDIGGKPMLWRVYQRVRDVPGLDAVFAATDDQRIFRVCQELGIPARMTDPGHRTAAGRLWEASEMIPADFYIQINGDEPLINPRAVEAAIPKEAPLGREFGTNVITPITDPAQVMDASNIKVVFDSGFRALYMSRTPVPYPFKNMEICYYKHVGIIGYNKKMLDFYRKSEPGFLERTEGIDTLRFLDYGKELRLIPVEGLSSLSVDTPQDLEFVRAHFAAVFPC